MSWGAWYGPELGAAQLQAGAPPAEPIEAIVGHYPQGEFLPPPDDLIPENAGTDVSTTMDVTAVFFPPAPFEEAIEVLIAADPIPHQQSDYEVQQPRGPPWDQYAFVDQVEWWNDTLHLENNAEGGTDDLIAEDDPNNTGGASGDAFDAVTGSAPVRFEQDRRIDTLSYKFEKPLNNGGRLEWSSPEWTGYPAALGHGRKELYTRFYMWMGGPVPSGEENRPVQFWNQTFNIAAGVGVNDAGQFTMFASGSPDASGGSVPFEHWVRIELHAILGTGALREARIWYTDPNSGGAPDVTLGPIASAPGEVIIDAAFGWNQGYLGGGNDMFIDNIGVSTEDWLGPLGTAAAETVVPSTPAVIHNYDPVMPWPTRVFEEWDHVQLQSEFLFLPEPPAEIAELIAAQPVFEVNPHPNPDFFIWDHRPDQIEWRSSRVVLNNTAEGGVKDVEVTEANSGGASGQAWDFVTSFGAGSTALYFGTDQLIDTMGYRFETFADFTGVHVRWRHPGLLVIPQPELFARFYFWTGSLPNTGEVTLVLMQNTNGVNILRGGFNSSGRFFLADTVDTVTSAVEPLKEQWVRIEMYCSPKFDYAEMRYYLDPNAGIGFPTGTLIQNPPSVGSLDVRDVFFGWVTRSVDGDEPLTFFMDNIGVDNLTWMGPLGTAPATTVPPSTPAVIHPYDVVMPWPTRVFEEWDHVQPQDEFLSPFIPPLITIEDLIAADMFSSGDYPSRPVEPTDTFQTYDQNPDPAPMIPPGLTGLIRRVPRWAKHGRYFLPGGRFP